MLAEVKMFYLKIVNYTLGWLFKKETDGTHIDYSDKKSCRQSYTYFLKSNDLPGGPLFDKSTQE